MALAAALQQHVGAAELRPVPELPNTIGHLHGQGVQVPPPGLPPLPPSLPGLSAVPPRLDVPPRPPASPLTAAMAPWEAGTPSVTRLGEPHPAGLPSAGGLPQDLAGAALPDLASLGLQPLPALPPPLSGGLPLPPLPPLASLPPPTTDAERRGTGRDATTSGRRHFEGSHMLSLHVHRIHRLHLDRKLTKPCVRVHLISEKTGAHIPRRSVGGSLAVDGEAQAAMMEAPGRPDLVGAPVTGERRWQPQLMTYVPAAQTKPRVVYHDEGSGSLRVDYDEELALFHDLQDALDEEGVLLFQLLQPPNSFRHRNVDGRLFDREGGTFRHVAWGFLRLKGPEEQFLEGEQSVQLYAYRRSQRGRGHEYAVREAFETWARSMHAGARALTRLKLLASLSVAVRAEPRDRPMPVVNDAAKGVRPCVPAGAGWGWDVGRDARGMAALGMATEVVRLRQLAGLPWLEGAAAGQLRSPIAGIGHPTGEAAARVVRFEGGSGLPGARREPGEPCELPNRPLYALRGHPRGALAVSFSHRGDLLAVVGGDIPEATLTVFRVDSGVPVATFAGHKGMVYDLDWSPEGDRLATASADLTAKVWAMPDLAERGQGAGHGGPRRLEVERACVVMQHASYVYASCFSTLPGDVGVVATGDFTGTLRLWDGREGVQLTKLQLASYVSSLAFHPLGRRIYAGDGKGMVYEIANEVVPRYGGQGGSREGPDPALAALMLPPVSAGATVEGYERRLAVVRESDALLGERVTSVRVSPQGRRVLVLTRGSRMVTFTASQLAVARQFHGIVCQALPLRPCFSPDGRWILSGSEDGSVVVWDVDAGHAYQCPALKMGKDPVLQFAWSPIDHILASCTLSPARPTVLRIHDVKVDPVLLRKMGGPDDGEVRALRQLRRHGVSEDAGGDEGGQAAAEADALKDALTPADVSRMLERMRIQVRAKRWYDGEFQSLVVKLSVDTRLGPGGFGGFADYSKDSGMAQMQVLPQGPVTVRRLSSEGARSSGLPGTPAGVGRSNHGSALAAALMR